MIDSTDELLQDTSSSERIRGYANSWSGRFGTVVDQCGESYRLDNRELEPDFCGRIYLLENEALTFCPTVDAETGHRSAKNAKVISRPLYMRLPSDWREWVEVADVSAKGFGWAIRRLLLPDESLLECGRLYFHVDNIVSGTFQDIHAGTQLWVGIAPPFASSRYWSATHIEVFNEWSAPSEISSVPEQPAVAPEIAETLCYITEAKQYVKSSKKHKRKTREQQKAAGEAEVYTDANVTAKLGLGDMLKRALRVQNSEQSPCR